MKSHSSGFLYLAVSLLSLILITQWYVMHTLEQIRPAGIERLQTQEECHNLFTKHRQDSPEYLQEKIDEDFRNFNSLLDEAYPPLYGMDSKNPHANGNPRLNLPSV